MVPLLSLVFPLSEALLLFQAFPHLEAVLPRSLAFLPSVEEQHHQSLVFQAYHHLEPLQPQAFQGFPHSEAPQLPQVFPAYQHSEAVQAQGFLHSEVPRLHFKACRHSVVALRPLQSLHPCPQFLQVFLRSVVVVLVFQAFLLSVAHLPPLQDFPLSVVALQQAWLVCRQWEVLVLVLQVFLVYHQLEAVYHHLVALQQACLVCHQWEVLLLQVFLVCHQLEAPVLRLASPLYSPWDQCRERTLHKSHRWHRLHALLK